MSTATDVRVAGVPRPASPIGRIYGLGSIFYLRGDVSYLTNTITGADFGHPESSMTISPGFNAAASIGFDLRRVGMFNAGPAR